MQRDESRRDAPIEVILAGAGGRAHAFAALLARSRAARVVALVARDPSASLPGLSVPRFASLDAALDALGDARVAAALPPRASLEAALVLAAAGRPGVVEAPLARALAMAALPSGAAAVQVAHGFVTLPGAAWLARALAERPASLLTIEARGLPEEPGADADEVLVHALALALRLCPEARVERAARPSASRVEVELSSRAGPVRLVAHARGGSIEVHAQGPGRDLRWRAQEDRETLISRAGGDPTRRERAVSPAPARALHQLIAPAQAGGDDLAAAQRVARLAEDVHAALGAAPPPGTRALRHSARLARERPGDLLAQLGLRGELPPSPPAPTLRSPVPPEPLELWAFRAGRKPVAFLTVRPEEAERAAAWFEGAHVERRERRVRVGPQDAWTDRRDEGEPRIELYVSSEPALAREAARLQSELDPSAAVRELGALMGYPACCVEAFAAQDDRANNTRNRYATAARTAAGERWPFELANLSTMLIPCYPCSYTCGAALELARAVLAQMEAAHPGVTAEVRAALARPVLYFDHDRQIALDGEASGERARYRGAAVPETNAGLGALGGVIASGDELVLDEEALVVLRRGAELLRLARTDPSLGLLAPFGAA